MKLSLQSNAKGIVGNQAGRKGSALLLVMWALLFMSITVLGVVEFVAYGLDDSISAQKEFRARQLAESGLALGFHPRVRPGDPILEQEFPGDESLSVQIEPEDGRMPINMLLANNSNETMRELFLQWGLSDREIAIVMDSLADWVDGNQEARMNGAENEYYKAQGHPEYPRNRPFQSLDEMRAVRGMDLVEAVRPDWRLFFTVYGSGLLNVNGASAEAIQGVLGVTQTQAQDLVDRRNGPDGLADTEDDLPFRSLEEVRDVLGMSPEEFTNFSPRLAINSSVRRVTSSGRAGNCSKNLIVIAALAKGKRPLQLATFEESPTPQ